MMRRFCQTIALFAALITVACSGESTTEASRLVPRTQWWEGRWRAVTVDGQPLPATVGAVRYDSLMVSFGGVISSFGWSAVVTSAARPIEIGCNGLVTVRPSERAVEITGPDRMNNCPYLSLTGRTFTRDGDAMVHEWDGRRWVLRKVQ
jgi:hypothetical protein